MTRWTYEDVRGLYRRAEEAEARAEKAETEVASLKARIATLESRIYSVPRDEDDREAQMGVEITRLEARQQEHLALIKRLSMESVSHEEADELRVQMGALIAEIGSLRAALQEKAR
jgi:chromosome segregation ATPase